MESLRDEKSGRHKKGSFGEKKLWIMAAELSSFPTKGSYMQRQKNSWGIIGKGLISWTSHPSKNLWEQILLNISKLMFKPGESAQHRGNVRAPRPAGLDSNHVSGVFFKEKNFWCCRVNWQRKHKRLKSWSNSFSACERITAKKCVGITKAWV